MGMILRGTENFEFKLSSAGPPAALEELSAAAGTGTTFMVVDCYDVTFPDGKVVSTNLESVEALLGQDENPDLGFYESMDDSNDTDDLLEMVYEGEKETAEALVEHFAEREPVSVGVDANVMFRLTQDDWEGMLAYVNGKLPEDDALTLEEVGSFEVDTLLRFTPGEDTPNRADGTSIVQHFHQTLPKDGHPFLGFCCLVHAVNNDLEFFDLEEEPQYHKVLWRADGEKKEGDGDEEEDEEDEDDDS